MNPLFGQAIEFVADTVRLFYSGTAIDVVLSRFTDDFSWIGAGEVEFFTDKAAIVAYFVEQAPLTPACVVSDEEFCLASTTSETCLVMGRYRVRTDESTGMVLEEHQRCSYYLVESDGRLLIRHVHVSNPYQAMKDELYFPFEAGAQSYEYLQRLLREKTQTLELERERYRIALRSVTDVLFEYDNVQDVLVEYERISGSGEELSSEERRFPRYSDMIKKGTRMRTEDYARLSEALQSEDSAVMEVRHVVPIHGGEWRWVRIHVTLLRDRNGSVAKTVGSWKDITDERRLIDDLVDQARRDPLTKLFNQGTVSSLVDRALPACLTNGCGALLVFDVDDFKLVNDTFGHPVGDDLLVHVAQAMESTLEGEARTAARVGGDEFVVFLPDADRSRAWEFACELGRKAECLQGFDGPVTLSAGCALAGLDADTYEGLFRVADRALYRAKRAGKNRVRFVDVSDR